MAPMREVFIAVLLLAGCRTGINYVDPAGPRYVAEAASAASSSDSLRVVSFNVAYGKHVDRAIALFGSDPALRRADIVLLQEMDARGTRRIAEALGMSFVYYPAIRSKRTDRDFGNAVLTRWPIEDDDKLILPHTAFLRGTQRIATAATVRVRGTRVRVYSAHLGTPMEIGGGARRDQLRTILDDGAAYAYVLVGGDMNGHGLGEEAVARGFRWPTRDGPKTTRFGRWDHVFVKGLEATDAGTVTEARDVSDHLPVWAVALLPGSADSTHHEAK